MIAVFPALAVETVEPPITVDTFKSGDLIFDKSGDDWVYKKESGDVVGLEISGIRESIALLQKRIKVDLSKPLVVEYRLKFNFRESNSDATINVFLNPLEDEAWWIDPIGTGPNGEIKGGILDFLHSFGPDRCWGGKVGVDNDVEGGGLPCRSAEYPKNDEWVTVKVIMTKEGFYVVSEGDQGYHREEYYHYDLSNVKYIAIGFGDQHRTRVECDYIKVYYETPKPKLTLTLDIPKKVYLNEKATGILKVKNVGNTNAKNVKVTITSPSLGISVSKSYSLIPSKEARVITFEIEPKELGDFKVIATAEYEDSDGNRYTESTEEIISVLPASTTVTTTTVPITTTKHIPGFEVYLAILTISSIAISRKLKP